MEYNGIDERIIKCCNNTENSIQPGISFDEENGMLLLRFHYLEKQFGRFIDQKTKIMYMNRQSIEELIEILQSFLTD